MKLVWSPRAATIATGIALIALTNAIVLLGVAYNRSGEPESQLELTQRELWRPYRYGYGRDGSETVLTLRWRVFAEDASDSYYGSSYGAPAWLDQAKLASLGFDVSDSPRTARGGYFRILPREALIVLEFDGPVYRKALERARGMAREDVAGDAAGPQRKDRRDQGQSAVDRLKREETASSRLFAVDAGIDPAALRAKYPDRSRYAIVRGNIRAESVGRDNMKRKWIGRITGLQNDRISLPMEFRDTVGPPTRPGPQGLLEADKGAPYRVKVAFGKRFEPWIVAASPVSPAAAPSK